MSSESTITATWVIRNIWVIDPQMRRGYDCSTGSWMEMQSFAIENSPIGVDLSMIFAELS